MLPFLRDAKTQTMIPGEALYAVKPGAFPAVFVKIGRVKGRIKSFSKQTFALG
jgi:hypothetical protein